MFGLGRLQGIERRRANRMQTEMLGKFAGANLLPHGVEIGGSFRPHGYVHRLSDRGIVRLVERVAHRRFERQMDLKVRKLVELDVFDPLDKSPRQIILADHFDQSRVRIRIRHHRQARPPFAAIAQANTDGASVVINENLLDVMHRANLPAAMDVRALQHLSNRVRTAARKLGFFVARDHL